MGQLGAVKFWRGETTHKAAKVRGEHRPVKPLLANSYPLHKSVSAGQLG